MDDREIEALFARIDKNGDGMLTRAEIIKNLRKDPQSYRILRIPKDTVDSNKG